MSRVQSQFDDKQVSNDTQPVVLLDDTDHDLSVISDVSVQPVHGWYLPFKAVAEYLVACLLLVLLLPVILITALLVKLTSKGPAFYSQTRVGKDDRPFRIYKLRTMSHDAESLTGPVWSAGNGDSRITPLGRILRKTHIDEFPQLINVLLGQMTLIGPRPERPEMVAKLQWQIPHYTERHNVRPGITGLAQLKLPPDTDLESVCKKLRYDLFYVQQVNPWLDAKIMIFTGTDFLSASLRAISSPIRLPAGHLIEHALPQLSDQPNRD